MYCKIKRNWSSWTRSRTQKCTEKADKETKQVYRRKGIGAN